jgi:cell division protein FtsL
VSVLWQQRTHGVQRRHQQTDRTLALLFLGVVVVVSLMAAAYLSLVASNVRLARRVWALEQELMEWERLNQGLMVEITHLSSIPVLQRRSIEAGFVPAEDVDFYLPREP